MKKSGCARVAKANRIMRTKIVLYNVLRNSGNVRKKSAGVMSNIRESATPVKKTYTLTQEQEEKVMLC